MKLCHALIIYFLFLIMSTIICLYMYLIIDLFRTHLTRKFESHYLKLLYVHIRVYVCMYKYL